MTTPQPLNHYTPGEFSTLARNGGTQTAILAIKEAQDGIPGEERLLVSRFQTSHTPAYGVSQRYRIDASLPITEQLTDVVYRHLNQEKSLPKSIAMSPLAWLRYGLRVFWHALRHLGTLSYLYGGQVIPVRIAWRLKPGVMLCNQAWERRKE